MTSSWQYSISQAHTNSVATRYRKLHGVTQGKGGVVLHSAAHGLNSRQELENSALVLNFLVPSVSQASDKDLASTITSSLVILDSQIASWKCSPGRTGLAFPSS